MAYQKDVKNLVRAEGILASAIKVLDAYYSDLEKKLEEGSFLQKSKKDSPAPPEAELNMEGQSGKGNEVLEMLRFIQKSTVDEMNEAHADEEKAQHKYEDQMTKLKDEEAENEKSLVKLRKTLTEKEEDLLQAKDDHKKTVADKEAIEAYLLDIKPGCDFITKHYDERK